MLMLKNLVFPFLLIFSVCASQDICINEVASKGTGNVDDSKYGNCDWVEIYNNADTAINCKGYCLTDDLKDSRKFVLPDITLPSKTVLLLKLVGAAGEIDGLYGNFKISEEGESVYLFGTSGDLIDAVAVPALEFGESWGRSDDGVDRWQKYDLPTPSLLNSKSTNIAFSHHGGFYSDGFDLTIASDKGYDVHYTLDGSEPVLASPVINGSVDIQLLQKKSLSSVPTTIMGYELHASHEWIEPTELRNAGTVIRCQAFKDGTPVSSVYTHTYLVDPHVDEILEFPVFFLSIDSLSLFDYETGIYLPGKKFDESVFTKGYPKGNYHLKYIKPINLEFFDSEGGLVFNERADMRMRGYSSASFPQKSFKVLFRSDYGFKKLDYDLLTDWDVSEFKRFVFRNGGNNYRFSFFTDALAQSLIQDLNVETQGFAPCHAYFNGEYWGIFNLREAHDEYFFKYHYGVDPDSLIIVKGCHYSDHGDNAEYKDLMAFVDENDLSVQKNYEYVKSLVDMESLLDYYISQMYFANYDWPANNYRAWKTTHPDSKWKWAVFDLDMSLGYDYRSGFETNSFDHATDTTRNGWPTTDCSTLLLRSLFKNDEFKNVFVEHYIHLLENNFHPDTVVRKIDYFEKLYADQIEHHIMRWGRPVSYEYWQERVEVLRQFARGRPCVVAQQMKEFFELDFLDYNCMPIADSLCGFDDNVYPNPVEGELHITSESDIELLKLISATGSEIQVWGFSRSKRSFQIDMEQYHTGLYYLFVYNRKRQAVYKVVKK